MTGSADSANPTSSTAATSASGARSAGARGRARRQPNPLHHLGLLNKIVNEWSRRYPAIERDDFLGAGQIGLVAGCKLFDASRGTQPSTYLGTAIRNEIIKAITNSYTVRVPPNQRWHASVSSLDAPVFGGYRSTRAEMLCGTTSGSAERSTIVEEALDLVSERQQFVVRHYLAGYTFREVSEMMGVSHTTATNYWNAALETIRTAFRGAA